MSDRYARQLADARWQQRRLDVFGAAGFRCEDCGKSKNDGIQLDLHHCYYIKLFNGQTWEHPNELLMCLCHECHEVRQKLEESIHVDLAKILRFVKPGDLENEAWKITKEISTRQTERWSEAFS
jgi:hypothetical protein